MAEVPKNLTDKIVGRVMADLQPSIFVVYGKVGASFLVGGLLSLLLCGQFGVGVTNTAIQFNHLLHSTSELACALICGAIFSILPLALLRLQCHALQFQVIVRKKYHAVMIWAGSFGVLLASQGNFGDKLIYVAAWFIAAVTIFEFGGLTIQYLEKIFAQHNHSETV